MSSPPRALALPTPSPALMPSAVSITRYLESCNLPSTTKRKCASSSSYTTSSASDDDKQRTGPVPVGTKKGKDPVHPAPTAPSWPGGPVSFPFCFWALLLCPALLPSLLVSRLFPTTIPFPFSPGSSLLTSQWGWGW